MSVEKQLESSTESSVRFDGLPHFVKEGMEDVRTTDWSDEVSWFWLAVIGTALTPQGLTGVLRAGPKTLQGALVMPLMQLGYRRGVIKFGVITARKPNAAD